LSVTLWAQHAKLSGHFLAKMIGSETPYRYEHLARRNDRAARFYFIFFFGCV